MFLFKLAFVILAIASTSNASIGPHFDFAPVPHAYGEPTVFPPPVLPAPVYAGPALHVAPTQPLWPAPVLPAPATAPLLPAPVLPAPAQLWPAPAPVSYFPPPPAPLAAAPLSAVFDPLPYAPTYRAIPGPITKTHHLSVGFAHPAKVIAAPAPHFHPVKLIDGHSHAHIHTHSAPLLSHHHHSW